MSEHPILELVRGKLADPSKPFQLVVTLETRPGCGDALAAAVTKSQAIRLSRLEPGCIAYDIGRDTGAPGCFVVQEGWRDLAALREHLATAHFAAIGSALVEWLAGPPAIRVLTPVR